MAKFITIKLQKSIKAPAETVARKEHRVARAMMLQAIADFEAKGVALRVATDKRIVTEFGETLYLE
jgi:predicted transcriptional regulator